jgi:Leucine-rich repeat (LRR) protein
MKDQTISNNIISFRGAEIFDYEAEFLKQLEGSLNKQFTLLQEVDFKSPLGFIVKINHVSTLIVHEFYEKFDILSESIGNLKNLEKLFLKRNGLKKLPNSLGELKQLEELNLRGNSLISIPKSIGTLKNLNKLNLRHNSLSNLPEEIGELENLCELKLENNELTQIPHSIGNLKSLLKIYLSNNYLKEIPNSIGKLISLQEIKLKNNKLKDLPDSIGDLHSLEALDLSNNSIEAIPEFIGNLTSLKSLDLNGNKINFLPDNIGNLRLLNQLYLNNNRLSSLPYLVGNLELLESLDLRYNPLTNLPDSIYRLKLLDASTLPKPITENNLLQKFEFEIKILESFEKLLDKRMPLLDKIKANTEIGFTSDNGRITGISFFQCGLENFPEKVTNFEKLQVLNLSNNNIPNLPESVVNLKEIQELYLIKNPITCLPESIEKLKSLRELWLNVANLNELPETISGLKSLQTLHLGGNKLKRLPISIWKLKELKILSLQNNPWEGEWKEISKRDIKSILDYCKQQATINVFLSHAVVDFNYFHIKEISEHLERLEEIYQAYFCEEDLKGDIDKFMNETVPKSQLLLFFASLKSAFNSVDCAHEIELARKNSIEIAPIKGENITWADLEKLGLNREPKFDYVEKNLEFFLNKLYEFIKQFKNQLKMQEKQKERIEKIISNLINFLSSKEIKSRIKTRLMNFEEIFKMVNNDKITLRDYFVKSMNILIKDN